MFGILAVESRLPIWQGASMQGSGTKAGGFFLTLCILAGLGAGILVGNPMQGVLFGTVAGVALAVLTWALDRRRRP